MAGERERTSRKYNWQEGNNLQHLRKAWSVVEESSDDNIPVGQTLKEEYNKISDNPYNGDAMDILGKATRMGLRVPKGSPRKLGFDDSADSVAVIEADRAKCAKIKQLLVQAKGESNVSIITFDFATEKGAAETLDSMKLLELEACIESAYGSMAVENNLLGAICTRGSLRAALIVANRMLLSSLQVMVTAIADLLPFRAVLGNNGAPQAVHVQYYDMTSNDHVLAFCDCAQFDISDEAAYDRGRNATAMRRDRRRGRHFTARAAIGTPPIGLARLD